LIKEKKTMTPADSLRLGLILLLSAFLLTINLGQPWIGSDAHDGILFSAMARNYLRFGFAALKFGPAITMYTVESSSELQFYQHHPFLVPVMLAVNYATLGVSEAAARAMPVSFSLATVGVLFLLTRRLYGQTTALVATFIFATLPMITFFGRKVGYEAPSLFFILLSVYLYLRVLEGGSAKWLWYLAGSLTAGLLTDWQTFFLMPFLFLHFYLFGRNISRRLALSLVLIALPIAVLILIVLQVRSVNPADLQDTVEQGKVYMGLIAKGDPEGAKFVETAVIFSFSTYVKQLTTRLDILFAYPVLVSAAAGLWLLRYQGWEKGSIVLMLAGAGLAPCLVFWRSVYIHWWDTYFLTAPIAVLAALSCVYLYGLVTRHMDTPSPTIPNTPAVFVQALFVGMVLAGAIPRLYELHQVQPRLLPEGQLEQVELIPGLGEAIARRTPADAHVLIALAASSSAASGVGYYSWRRLVWDTTDGNKLAAALAGVSRPRPVFLLDWIDPHLGSGSAPPLTATDKSEVFQIAGQRFRWTRLR
jgi:4-amino-4-deoxy-L-arabinose transferase-like glycosyltransferase